MASSTGNRHPIRSSCAAMVCGVPTVVTIEKYRNVPLLWIKPRGIIGNVGVVENALGAFHSALVPG